MKRVLLLLLPVLLAGCNNDELSSISVRNLTEIPLYVQPYSTDYADGSWIQPGLMEDFYTIGCDCLDGFRYFSFYYDSLIVHIKDMEDQPVKFYKDGTTINYNPTLSPFTNPDVWKIREIKREEPGTVIRSNYREKLVIEHYFCISPNEIKSMKQKVVKELIPSF